MQGREIFHRDPQAIKIQVLIFSARSVAVISTRGVVSVGFDDWPAPAQQRLDDNSSPARDRREKRLGATNGLHARARARLDFRDKCRKRREVKIF